MRADDKLGEVERLEREHGEAQRRDGVVISESDRAHSMDLAKGRGLAKAPGWHRLHVLRSDVLRGLHRPLDALKAGEEGVRLEPDDPDCHAALALSASALGNHSEAILAFRRALALSPHTGHLHRWLADQCLALGDYDSAITHYHDALVPANTLSGARGS